MTKLVLSALIGLLALGIVAGTSTVQAAPTTMRCTGANSVWDDTDIVHLTKQGAGTLTIGWTAHDQVRLRALPVLRPPRSRRSKSACRSTSCRTAARRMARARCASACGNRHRVFTGRYTGTTTVNEGTLSLFGDFNGDGDVDGQDFLRMQQHGTIDRVTRQSTSFYIDDIIIGLK